VMNININYKGDDMSEALIIWLYLSLGSFVSFVVAVIIIFIAAFCVYILIRALHTSEISMYEEGYSDKWQRYKSTNISIIGKIPKKTVFLLLVIIWAYPSKDDLKYIIGGSLVINGAQAASDIEGVEKLPENLVNAMNVFLEKAVKDN